MSESVVCLCVCVCVCILIVLENDDTFHVNTYTHISEHFLCIYIYIVQVFLTFRTPCLLECVLIGLDCVVSSDRYFWIQQLMRMCSDDKKKTDFIVL